MFRQLRTVALLVSALLVLSAGAASAAEVIPEAETMFLDHINASRAEEGHAPLTMNTEMSGIARDWSHVMQAEDRMYHNPSYSQQYTGQWESTGRSSRWCRASTTRSWTLPATVATSWATTTRRASASSATVTTCG